VEKKKKNSFHWLVFSINLSELTEGQSVLSGVGAARGCIEVNEKGLTSGLPQSGGVYLNGLGKIAELVTEYSAF
jgi:hypothetical protein